MANPGYFIYLFWYEPKDESSPKKNDIISVNYTVSTYIFQRLQEIGIKYVFGVPGDYDLGFLDELVLSPVQLIGNCNELNAGRRLVFLGPYFRSQIKKA
jgi:hypothetical protein